MPAFVFGLPVHVLVVHAVVVLVPLAVAGTLVIALWPRARARLGWPVVALTLAATVLIPIATSSGERLRDRLEPTDLIRAHAHLGDQLLVFVAGLLAVSAALVWHDRRRRADAPGAARRVPIRTISVTLAALTIGLAAASAVQVVRIGDSGARAVWANTHYIAPHGRRGGG